MTKRNYDLTNEAKLDIINALTESKQKFGKNARTRYKKLIDQAIQEICIDPNRIGTSNRTMHGQPLITYHIAYSRKHASYKNEIVKNPRHIIVYKIIDEENILIVRVLHDAMDISRHLPSE